MRSRLRDICKTLYEHRKMSTYQVAEALDISPSTVYRTLKGMGIIRSRSEAMKIRMQQSPEFFRRIVKLPRLGARKYVVLPEEWNADVAALDAIIRGDGHLEPYRLTISGHAVDEFHYLNFYVIPLIQRIHKVNRISINKVKTRQSLNIRVHSRNLVEYWRDLRGIVKDRVGRILPPQDLPDQFELTWLGSFFDTEGCITFYGGKGKPRTNPAIMWTSSSEPLINFIKTILQKYGFNLKLEKDTVIIRNLPQYERALELMLAHINNPKHLTKILLFEIWGFVPLKVEISDRIRIIRGEADPRLFYEKFDESSLTAYARRKIERKVLESLSPESRYAASISRDLGIDQANIMRALKRLERLRLSKFVEHGAKGSKIYKITQRGLEKLTRVNRILQKLHKLNVALPSE